MKVADFFCGAGGFSEGFRQAGFEIVFAVDKWLPAVNTYKGNKPNVNVIQDDVIRLSNLTDDEFNKIIPDTEIIIGSPPCVAFSSSNKSGNGDKALGIKLLESYLRIVARKMFKPDSILRYWILENVPNIEKHIKDVYTASDLGLVGDFVLTTKFESTGVYNAKYFGAPTNRKRFLCGNFPKPIETNNDSNIVTLNDVLSSLGEPLSNLNRQITDCNYKNLVLKKEDVTDHQYIYKLLPFEWQTAKRLKIDRGYMGKMSFPENIFKPSRTVMATMSACSRESMILGYGEDDYRLPTVREVASMMSFPNDYKFYGNSKGVKYKLVGNSVPPKLSFALATAIANENNMPKLDYRQIHHNNTIEFYNLNYVDFPDRVEKPKRSNSKFKYHIPFLIEKSYRVELTNHKSDFIKEEYIWTVEIRFGQGIEKAKVLTPKISELNIDEFCKIELDKAILNLTKLSKTHNRIQEIYCMTSIQRNGEIGPFELLEKVRDILDNTMIGLENAIEVKVDNKYLKIPKNIVFGYYLLKKITEKWG